MITAVNLESGGVWMQDGRTVITLEGSNGSWPSTGGGTAGLFDLTPASLGVIFTGKGGLWEQRSPILITMSGESSRGHTLSQAAREATLIGPCVWVRRHRLQRDERQFYVEPKEHCHPGGRWQLQRWCVLRLSLFASLL